MYGYIRATTDIDFFYHRTPGNVARLVDALRAFGAPEEVIDPVHLATPARMVAFGEPPTRIDLLAGIDGVSFAEAQASAVQVEVATT